MRERVQFSGWEPFSSNLQNHLLLTLSHVKSCLLPFLESTGGDDPNGTAENFSQESSAKKLVSQIAPNTLAMHRKCCKVFHKYNGLALIFFLTPGEFVSLDPIVLPAKGGRAELLDVTALSELKLLQCERSIMCVALCRKG